MLPWSDPAAARHAYRDAIRGLTLVDVNAWAGPHPDPYVTGARTVAELLEAAADAGIGACVVTHTDSLYVDPVQGNERLFAELDALGGSGADLAVVTPAVCLVPDDPPEPYLQACIARGARLARLFPRSHRFSLSAWCSGALLDALEGHRLPVMIRHTEASWDDLHALCLRHPNLPVIVDGADQKLLYHNRALEALLRAHPRLSVETHNLVLFPGLHRMVEHLGAGRLLFGTCMPFRDPHAALGALALSDVPAADRKRIAGGNWRALASAVSAVSEQARGSGGSNGG